MILRAPRSLLARAAALVLVVALLAGVAGLWLAGRIARRWEARFQRDTLEAMMDLAEANASAACYTHDPVLAEQVVQHFLAAEDVRGAILAVGPDILARAARPGPPVPADRTGALTRALPSPFSAATTVGELTLLPDPVVARRQGARIASLVRAPLLGLTLALGLALLLAVHAFIVRPITALSRQLHRLDTAGGGLLETPRGHEGDEIGQLARDANHLIERLVQQDWDAQAKGRPERPAPEQGRGVFALSGAGSLEVCTPACLALLGLDAEPPPGAHFPVLFGAGAHRLEACLDQCRNGSGRAATTFPARDREGGAQRWLRLTVERTGPDWFQGLLEEAPEPARALSWDGVERRRAAGS